MSADFLSRDKRHFVMSSSRNMTSRNSVESHQRHLSEVIGDMFWRHWRHLLTSSVISCDVIQYYYISGQVIAAILWRHSHVTISLATPIFSLELFSFYYCYASFVVFSTVCVCFLHALSLSCVPKLPLFAHSLCSYLFCVVTNFVSNNLLLIIVLN